jgi:ATPase subunit of ABC transporter with duplicated ATPase domains
LLVSHDRYLIDGLGSQIWEILPGQAMLQVFDGTYTQYREFLDNQQALQAAKVSLAPQASAKKSRPAPASAEEKKRRIRLKEVEERIAHLEREIAVLSRKLETPPADLAKVQQLGQEYAGYQDEMEQLMLEWEALNGEEVQVGG